MTKLTIDLASTRIAYWKAIANGDYLFYDCYQNYTCVGSGEYRWNNRGHCGLVDDFGNIVGKYDGQLRNYFVYGKEI